MSGSYEQRAAAREAADLMTAALDRVSGRLEEVATVWRRAELYGQRSSSMAPGSLQDATRSLADTVRALPDAGSEERPVLAFAAVAQLAALERNAVRSAAVTAGRHLGDAEIWVSIQDVLVQAGNQLWRLISHLVKIGELSLAEEVTALRDAPATWSRPPQPDLAAADCSEPGQALAMQRTAIDALPEIDLRRLLTLIGGMDPAALQRAAAAYTEMFCTVASMEASVAALRPVAVAAGQYLPDP